MPKVTGADGPTQKCGELLGFSLGLWAEFSLITKPAEPEHGEGQGCRGVQDRGGLALSEFTSLWR